MQASLLIVFLLGAWAPGVDPARAGDAPQPPAAVARDIEILNLMLQQRKASTAIQTPSPSRTSSPSQTPQPSQILTPSTEPAPAALPAAVPGIARITQLIVGLNDEAQEVREMAQGELVKIGAPAVPDLLIALEDDESLVRVGAAKALGSIKDPRAAEPLAGLLGDSLRELWIAVYSALSGIGPPAVPALLDVLGNPDSTVRWRAVRLLGVIHDPAATETLVALLNKDQDTGVRVEIATALGKIKDRTACDALLDALHDW